MTSVVVVGDVMVDVVVRVVAPFAHASDTPSSITTAPGGAAANQAVWMARAGAQPMLVAAVGRDAFGDAARSTLSAEGVDVALMGIADAPTGVVVALVEPDGQRSMLTDRGANLTLRPQGVERAAEALRDGAHLHVSGYSLFDEPSRAAGLRAIELARESGATFSVDGCSAGPLAALGAERFLGWTQGARFLFCNVEECEVLAGPGDPAERARTLTSGAEEVVVTLGAAGVVVVLEDGTVERVDALSTQASDTTGAGDAFSGTYLARRLSGATARDALELGALAAARCVSEPGARAWR